MRLFFPPWLRAPSPSTLSVDHRPSITHWFSRLVELLVRLSAMVALKAHLYTVIYASTRFRLAPLNSICTPFAQWRGIFLALALSHRPHPEAALASASLYRNPGTPPYLFLLPVAARRPRKSALANRYLHIARAAAMTICEYRLPTYHDARVLLVAVTACSCTRLRSHDTSPDADTARRNLALFRIRRPSLGLMIPHLAVQAPRLPSSSAGSFRSTPHAKRSRSCIDPNAPSAHPTVAAPLPIPWTYAFSSI